MLPGSTTDAARAFAEARAAMAGAWAGTGSPTADVSAPAAGPEHGLTLLVDDALRADAGLAAIWLLQVALTGAFPGVEELEDAALTLRTGGAPELLATATRAATDPARSRDSRCLSGTVVDVTSTARATAHAGVPRVVRQLVSVWGEPEDLNYVVWEGHGLRTVNETERTALGLTGEPHLAPASWVVPWRARYVAAEVLRPERHAIAVEAMALAGVVDLRAIVYDLAAVAEPDQDATRGPFLHYLSALARGSRISAISEAVAGDVRDYLSLLARNGRPRAHVEAHVLPDGTRPAASDPALRARLEADLRGDPSWPLLAVVSSIYRRKNHARVVSACERLWREGLRFRLLVVTGTSSRVPAVDQAIDRLVESGRPLTVLTGVDEQELQAIYELSSVTAYVSLAEGYGLPIAESLSAGTPVVTSGHGSMAEIGQEGGVLLVDPRDDESIVTGLRTALADRTSFQPVVDEARNRPPARSWQDYAATVGDFLGIPDTAGRAS